jgi:anti-sigma B factor antagonist
LLFAAEKSRAKEQRKPMADLLIETRFVQGTPVLDLTGEVDSYNSPRLKERMVAIIEEGAHDLTVNLTGVDYIDSTGLGTLVAGLKRAKDLGGGIRIICPKTEIYKVFTITGLVRVFEMFEDEQKAFGL